MKDNEAWLDGVNKGLCEVKKWNKSNEQRIKEEARQDVIS